MQTDLIDWLINYQGNAPIVKGIRGYYKKHGMLTQKQTRCIETIKNKTTQQPKEEKAMDNMGTLFELEELEPTTLPEESMPQANYPDIEKIIGDATASAIKNALLQTKKESELILAKCRALTTQNSKVMHIKLGDTPIQKLTHEAHTLLPKLLVVAKLGKNSLLIGPKGCGKTTLAEQVAEAMGLRFGHLGLTAGASESWLFGRQTPNGFHEAQFSNFYRNGGVFLLDEIDAADANLLLCINTALASGRLYNPILGEEIKRHKDFVCIAAANTACKGADGNYTGRVRLDASTIDRFIPYKLDYDKKLESKLLPDAKLLAKLHSCREKLQERGETISTRKIKDISDLITAGYPEKDALQTLAEGFPEGLAEEVGLFKQSKKDADDEIGF